jgi:hypothetical protein
MVEVEQADKEQSSSLGTIYSKLHCWRPGANAHCSDWLGSITSRRIALSIEIQHVAETPFPKPTARAEFALYICSCARRITICPEEAVKKAAAVCNLGSFQQICPLHSPIAFPLPSPLFNGKRALHCLGASCAKNAPSLPIDPLPGRVQALGHAPLAVK